MMNEDGQLEIVDFGKENQASERKKPSLLRVLESWECGNACDSLGAPAKSSPWKRQPPSLPEFCERLFATLFKAS
jgi:hypothetical protein